MQFTLDDSETEKERYSKDDTKREVSTTDIASSSFTAEDEKRLLRRIDLIVLPMLCTVAFLQVIYIQV